LMKQDMIEKYMNVDIRETEARELADISKLQLDTSIAIEKRFSYVLEKLNNPFCFRCGEMGIKLEFDESGPSVQEAVESFFLRKKSEF
jgi:hypothetical protein